MKNAKFKLVLFSLVLSVMVFFSGCAYEDIPGLEVPDAGASGVVMVWIPTNGGTKYHENAGCSNMIDPEYVSLDYARDQGFTPCKRCYE